MCRVTLFCQQLADRRVDVVASVMLIYGGTTTDRPSLAICTKTGPVIYAGRDSPRIKHYQPRLNNSGPNNLSARVPALISQDRFVTPICN